MAFPVVERIADVIITRLEVLRDNANAEVDVTEVVRPKRLDAYTPKDGQIVVTQGANDREPELDHAGNPPAVARRQVFNIRCHVMNSEKSTDAVDEIVNTFAAEVIKAITTPQSEWHNFGSLAIDAEFDSFENIDSDGSFDGINLPLAVIYRTSENDPYTVRA
jgi:hypothetical protein